MTSYQKKKRIKDDSALDLYRGKPCVICRKPSDPCHIISRGAGGHDIESNLISLCRQHHTESHAIGWRKFSLKHFAVYDALLDKGWDFLPSGKLIRKN